MEMMWAGNGKTLIIILYLIHSRIQQSHSLPFLHATSIEKNRGGGYFKDRGISK